MSKGYKLLLAAVLGLVWSWSPAAAQDIRIEPIPPHIKPQWTAVPNAAGVYWAPNIPTDVFRHGTKYYLYWEGYLYQGSKPKGPWKSVTKVPGWFSEIDPSYFKTAPKEVPTPPAGQPGGPPGPPAGVAPGAPAPAPSAPEKIAPPAAPAPAPEKEEAPPAPAPGPGGTPKAPKIM